MLLRLAAAGYWTSVSFKIRSRLLFIKQEKTPASSHRKCEKHLSIGPTKEGPASHQWK
jgi:hypothetical protein